MIRLLTFVLVIFTFSTSCGNYVWDSLSKQAPSISTTSIQGTSISIPSNGKAQILHFWAFNHPLSRQSLAYMNELNQKAQKKGVQLIVVCLNWSGSEVEINDYLKRSGFTFDVVFDKENTFAQKFEVYSLPQTQIIERNGMVKHRLMGLREDINFVDEILKKAQ